VNVRSSLFVLAVGHIDGDETVPLVEASSRDVALKRPQIEALRTDFLCEADERRPESTPRPLGIDIQLVDPPVGEDQQRDWKVIMLDDPHVAARHNDGCEPLAGFVVGVRGAGIAGIEA